MPRGSKPGERRGGRQCTTPNKRTVLTDRILAAASEHPGAALHELLASLVKDQALAADIRIAVARNTPPARASRSSKALAAGTNARPGTAGLVTLDVLFSIVQDATTAPAQRRKAASEAALHFLPKTAARGWPGAVADEYGFVISAKMAIEYRDSVLQLQHLLDSARSNIPATKKTTDKLRARIKMIEQRLECPCPSLYDIKRHWQRDRERVRELAEKRQAKIALSEEESAEEAHRMARSRSLVAGADQAARRRLNDLREKARASKRAYGPRLTRRERVDLRLLRLLYSPAESAFTYKPDEDPHYHPLRDEPFAENGNLYPPDSRLRPAPSGAADEDFVEFVDCPPYVTGNPNDPDCPEMSAWLADQKPN
jgi:hypothetical protein